MVPLYLFYLQIDILWLIKSGLMCVFVSIMYSWCYEWNIPMYVLDLLVKHVLICSFIFDLFFCSVFKIKYKFRDFQCILEPEDTFISKNSKTKILNSE